MTKKFVVGAAKLIDGRDAYIFETTEEAIFGKIKHTAPDKSFWQASTWKKDGSPKGFLSADLLPNAAPLQVEFVTFVDQSAKLDSLWSYCYSKELIGKKVKVVVTEILE